MSTNVIHSHFKVFLHIFLSRIMNLFLPCWICLKSKVFSEHAVINRPYKSHKLVHHEGSPFVPREEVLLYPWGQSTVPTISKLHWFIRCTPSPYLHPHCAFSCEDSLQKTRLLSQPLCLEKNVPEDSWQESEAFVESLSPRPPCALNPVLKSVLAALPVCPAVSCSTPDAAFFPLVAGLLLSLELIFASCRNPGDWSFPGARSQSWACCWDHGRGGPAHAPCRCQASSLVSWTGWWSSWSVSSSCWCQCWNVASCCPWRHLAWRIGCFLKSSVQPDSDPFLIFASRHFFSKLVSGHTLHCSHSVRRWPAGNSRRRYAESDASWLKPVEKYTSLGLVFL